MVAARCASWVHSSRGRSRASLEALERDLARRLRREKRVLELVGTLEWDEGYDYKAERGRG